MPYKKSKYKRFKQRNPKAFIKDTFRTVPLSHTKYRGEKFSWFVKFGNAKAIIGVLKINKREVGIRGGKITTIQSILIPNDEIDKINW